MPAHTIEGYVIVSADGMLANADHVMPDALKFDGDKRFFSSALDRADLIVPGRNSGEDQPNAPKRKRVILTHSAASLARDPSNPKAILWNPNGASFEDACGFAAAPSPSSTAPSCALLFPVLSILMLSNRCSTSRIYKKMFCTIMQ